MWHLAVFVSISTFVAIRNAETILPTSTTGSTIENYINSEYNITSGNSDYWYFDDIYCGTETCNVYCDAYQGCYYTNIHVATTTRTLNIKCTDTYSCRYMDIHADSVWEVNIECTAASSCYRANIYGDYITTSLNVQCSNDQACYYLDIEADTVPNVDISCDWNLTSAYYDGACYQMSFYGTNAGDINLKCTSYDCYSLAFYAEDALSLTIDPEGTYALYSGYFFVDRLQSGFDLSCNGTYECYNVQFWTTEMTSSVSISCYNNYACQSMYLHAGTMTSSVSISCHGNYACQSMYLDGGTMTGDVTVTCADLGSGPDYPCHSLTIETNNIAGSLTLDCVDGNSCQNIYAYCPETSCNINCNQDNSCYYATIYIQNPFDVTFLNIQCAVNSTSCSYANLQCIEGTAGSSQLVYDSATNGWACATYGCCPYREDRACTAGEHCEIDCAGSCAVTDIDASTALSLTLNCSGASACEGATVQCPTTNGASCTIHCPDSYSCRYVYILAGDENTMDALDVQCGGSYSCQQMYIEANASVINTITVNCTYNNACYSMEVSTEADITNINIDCGTDYACQYASFVLGTADTVTLDCGGYQSCYSVNALQGTAGALSIDCSGYQSCYSLDAVYTLDNEQFVLDCVSQQSCGSLNVYLNFTNENVNIDINCMNAAVTTYSSYSACYNAYFYLYGTDNNAESSSVSVQCNQYDCYNTRFYIYDPYNVDFGCNGSWSCQYMYVETLIANDNFVLDCLSQESCEGLQMRVYSTKEDANIALNCMNAAGTTSISYAACGSLYFYLYGYNSNNGKSNNFSVQCADYECYNAQFYIYDTYHIDFGCNDPYSCQSMYLYTEGSVDYLNLLCNDMYSCTSATIYCPYKDIGVCDIDCSSTQSCSYLNIYVPGSYVYDYLDLQCDTIELNGTTYDSTYSCDQLEVYCSSGSRSSVSYHYNNTMDDYECSYSGSGYCCPYYSGPKIICTKNVPCVIDCREDTCTDEYIDGVEASFLTVYCAANNCSNAYIYCPNAGCSIECPSNGCYYTNIIYNGQIADQGTVSITCTGSYGCQNTQISAEYIDTLNVNCSAARYSYNYICYYMIINAQYANTVNFDLYESYGSYYSTWNIDNAITVNYNARGSYGSYRNTIHAEYVGTMTVNCVSEDTASCCYSYWYIPSDATFNCFGGGCQNIQNVYPTEGIVTDLTFNMHSCGECLSVGDCFSNFYLYCWSGTSFSNNQYLTNGVCSTDYECGCDTLLDNVVFSVSENTDQCYSPVNIIVCEENEMCEFECDYYSETGTCSDTIIDGSTARHLTVTCAGSQCQSAVILCPDYGCQIDCRADWSCYDAMISYTGDTSFGATISVTCGYYGCYSMELHAPDAHRVEIHCSTYGWYYGAIYVSDVNELKLNATDPYAFSSVTLYGDNAKYMVIACLSDDGYYACYGNTWYLPDDVNFLCYGWGCRQLGSLRFNTDMNNVEWTMDACGQCYSAYECVYDFDVQCGRTSTSYSYNDYFYYTSGPNSNSGQYGNCSMPVSQEDCGCYDTMTSMQVNIHGTSDCEIEFPRTKSPTRVKQPTAPTTPRPTPAPTAPTPAPVQTVTVADSANVISIFTSFAVVIAMVTSY